MTTQLDDALHRHCYSILCENITHLQQCPLHSEWYVQTKLSIVCIIHINKSPSMLGSSLKMFASLDALYLILM